MTIARLQCHTMSRPSRARRRNRQVRPLGSLVLPWLYSGMKTAISLPDELFADADRMAVQLGMSRSQLYATALAEYLARHRESDVTAALDRVYGHGVSSDDAHRAAAHEALRRTEWT
jgi:predicted transcriptional regulator